MSSRQYDDQGRWLNFTFNGRKFHIPYRDQQRQRCYRAEQAVDWGDDRRGKMTLEECQAFCDMVMATTFWRNMRKRHGFTDDARHKKVRVEPKNSGANADVYLFRIGCAKSMASKHVMLHELAHIACGPNVWHHWPFARAYAELVGRFMGPEYAKQLKAQYKRKKVHYTVPPPPLSEERKRQLAEQGAKALGLKLNEEVGA